MNHEKTGALIAKRRAELRLTQKALAEQLNISDRTVSKWERGLGFPDISLIESLADALGLTVLELLHGEEEPPTPEEERSAREMLNNIRPEVHEKMKKSRRWIIVLTVLLVAAAVALIWVVSGVTDWHWEETTVTEATAVSEQVLITEQEYELMHVLYQEFLAPEGENAWATEAERYRGDLENYIHPEADLGSTTYNISVREDYVEVTYGDGDGLYTLTVRKKGAMVSKHLMLFDSAGNIRQVDNAGNDQFHIQVRETGFAALFH